MPKKSQKAKRIF